jgi:hypothetical protein
MVTVGAAELEADADALADGDALVAADEAGAAELEVGAVGCRAGAEELGVAVGFSLGVGFTVPVRMPVPATVPVRSGTFAVGVTPAASGVTLMSMSGASAVWSTSTAPSASLSVAGLVVTLTPSSVGVTLSTVKSAPCGAALLGGLAMTSPVRTVVVFSADAVASSAVPAPES